MLAKYVLALIGVVCCCPIEKATAQESPISNNVVRILTFNILQGGDDASNVGFDNGRFGGSRLDEIVDVIRLSQAEIVCIQEDAANDQLLDQLGEKWQRVGSIYSKYKLESIHNEPWLTAAKAELPNHSKINVVNCHWSPADYGPFLVQDHIRNFGKPSNLEEFQTKILERVDKTDAARGYEATLRLLRPLIEKRQVVVLTGDFNEPSHLDWTRRYANHGPDRWVKNPTDTPLRCEIRWQGSVLLEEIGLQDVYRTVFTDEVKKPGNTWTPPYANGTPGRRDFDDQVLDRIDRIYFFGDKLRLSGAAVIGESGETSEIMYKGEWPSDHRAVVATFECVIQ